MKTLILALIFLPACAFAQTVAPAWLNQIKLSGINGFPDHPLMIINGKTLSSGEECDLKLKGRTVHVQCLEIHEQSVSVQIQGLSSPCELTFSGIYLPVESSPIAVPPPLVPATIVSSASASVTPIRLFVPTLLASQPDTGKSFSISISLVLIGMIFALLFGIGIGSGGIIAQQRLHQKNIGEAMVANMIDEHLPRPHLLLNNVTLSNGDGTTQIDHVLVADTGVFVIETKHFQGWIFGDPKESQWTQVIGRRKSRFQNPLRQNYAHVKALRFLFDLPENYFYSVAVFTGRAEFKSNLGSDVIHLASLISFLTAERPVIFDERKMAYVVGRIEMKRERRSLETDEYHINHVRRRFAGKT